MQPEHSALPMINLSEPLIFVSYAHKNEKFVLPEIERLKQDGYNVWIDEQGIQPASRWQEEIYSAIDQCACVLAFISYEALESQYVGGELNRALKANRNFVCVYLVEIKPSEIMQYEEKWKARRSNKEEWSAKVYERIRIFQGLELYKLHTSRYEADLKQALAKFVASPASRLPQEEERRAVPKLPPTDVGVLPKLVFTATVIFTLACFIFSVVTFGLPFFPSEIPNDPLKNPLAAGLAGSFFLFFTALFGGISYVVHKKYLKEEK